MPSFLRKAVRLSEGTGEARQRRDSLHSLLLRRLKITAATAGFSRTTPTLTYLNFISSSGVH